MHHKVAVAFILLSLIAVSCSPVVYSTEASMQRQVYLEPSYQIYIDDYNLGTAAGNFSTTFKLSSSYNIHSIRAYSPDNQSLQVTGMLDYSTRLFTVTVQAGELSSFRLVTILHATTIKSSNYTTPINFYPSINGSIAATTTVYMPLESELLAINDSTITSTVVGGRTILSGAIQTSPNATTFNNVTYNGTFSLVELQSLDRVFEVTSAGIHVSENFEFINVATAKAENATFTVPSGAANLRAYDSIGNLVTSINGDEMTVKFHSKINIGELAAFTLEYDLSASSISVSGNTISVSGNLLPDWCNYLVSELNLSIIMPEGSSNAVATDGVVNTSNGELFASYSGLIISPHFNKPYSLSFSYAAVAAPISWALILVIVLVIAVAAYVAYTILRRPKAVATVQTQTASSKKTPPPSKQPQQKQPSKK